MKKKIFNLILLGEPGAGKATQGARLLKKYPLREFDFGQWLRDLKGAEKRRYAVVTNSSRGILTPTNLAKRRFRDVIMETPASKGVFFNGNPKMVGEAQVMKKTFKESGRDMVVVVYLSIPKTEMLKRIQGRKGQARFDDQAEYLQNRMRYYRNHIGPTVKYLQKTYPFQKVSGVGSEAEVFARLTKTIEGLLKQASRI